MSEIKFLDVHVIKFQNEPKKMDWPSVKTKPIVIIVINKQMLSY